MHLFFALAFFACLPAGLIGRAERVAAPGVARDVLRTLTELEELWIQVYKSHDLSLLERILADDFVATLADGAIRDKRQQIAAYPDDFATYSDVTSSEVVVHVFSPDAAVVTGAYAATLRGTGAAPATQHYRWTDTWLQREGSWQCVARHETRIK